MEVSKEAFTNILQQGIFAQVEQQRNNALNEVANMAGENAVLRRQVAMQAEQIKQLQESLRILQSKEQE